MKVLVNFGEIRCIVPVGDGHLPVREVIHLAIDRYKKAINTPSNASVVVHNLKTCRDGAILDADDIIGDVADDREQIIACFEISDNNCSQELSPKHQNGIPSDRISTPSDSLGTGSPDVFINDDRVRASDNEIVVEDMNRKNMPNITIDYNDYNGVEITSDQINSGVCALLQVRRGSEPVLNRLSPDIDVCDPTKRWSTAVAVDSKNNRNASTHSLDVNSEHSDEDKDKSLLSSTSLSPPSIREEGYGSEEKSEHTPSSTTSNTTFSRFSRGSGRLSMIANNLDIWAEAADRQLNRSVRDKSQTKVSTQVNKNYNSLPKHLSYHLVKTSVSSMSSEDNTKHKDIEDMPSVIVNLAKESGPLGIHVVPDSDDIGCGNGLLIQGIEPGGRIDRDGRLHVGDSIIEINGQSILDVDFESAQQIFRTALQSDEISLRLIKFNQNMNQNQSSTPPKKSFPPPVLPKPTNVIKQHEMLRLVEGMVEGEERGVQPTKVATVTPTNKMTASAGHKPAVSSALVVANTRKIGKKYHIQLKKGSEGLGFSITTRDNPTGGNCPIYIKNILPKGAAVEDGRLRPGDRLLEVCGIEMTGKSQTEAVKILRTISLGTTVDLIVSRQEQDLSPSPMMPRQLPPEKSGETPVICGNEREVLTFEIPLNDTGSAGLGVSVKGKTSTSSGEHSDLGIFVKSVIHGGAASKDGRLKTNDQLININGIPLLGMTNSQAMETLRRAMIQSEGPIANPNAITLTVARKSMPFSSQLNSSCHQRNDSLLSATSNDSCNEESLLSANNETLCVNSYTFDDTYDNSYRSADNTVIYKPKSEEKVINRLTDREGRHLCSSIDPNKPVISQTNQSSNQTLLKQFYLSENHDSNRIYDKSPNIVNRSDVIIERDTVCEPKPESTPRDSQQSLSEENDDGFRRDGFGRQSISEKRHTQLDAKNTDTYRRNKKAKEEKERQLRDREDQSDPRDGSYSESQPLQPNTETNGIPHELANSPIILVNQRSTSCESLTLTTRHKKTRNNCSVNDRKCRSPGSCPYHSTHNTTKPNTNPPKDLGPALGMRKSSSLESLQTLMQDLQKEQLENVTAFSGPRPATVRVSRSRETNESFRAAVDKSYDVNNDENHETMETVAEEGSDSSSLDNIPNQSHAIPVRGPSGALSMASTHYTATTATSSQMTTEDETQGFLKKKNSGKKKGLFKTLFKFGSKKGRSSSAKPNTDREPVGEQNSDAISTQNAQQMYILEQERIQMHYKRLIEQQQHQQYIQQQSAQVSHTAQPTPPARQRSKSAIGERFGSAQPMHSTPTGVTSEQMTNHGLSHEAVLSRNERMAQLRAQHQRMHVERHRVYPNEGPVYGTYSSMDRKHQLDYNNHRVYSPVYSPNHSKQMYISYPINANYPPGARRVVLPQIESNYNENNGRKYPSNAFQRRSSSLRCNANTLKIPGTDVHHLRNNSYDVYRQAMERPGSRVGIADHNSKYSHYMNYREIQQQMHQYLQQQQQHSGQQYPTVNNRQIYGSVVSPVNAINPMPSEAVRHMIRGEHQRQVSSPVNSRPISNYFEYETTPTVGNQKQQQNNVNNNVLNTKDNSSSTSLTRRSKKYSKPGSQQSGTMSVPIVRHQQPIYQTNQLKIYGSTYSNGYTAKQHSNQPPVPIYDSVQGNSNTINGNSSNGYQIPSKYQALRPGSKV